MSQHSEIKSLIRSIANPSASGTSIFEAQVISASETSCTINYQGIRHSDVRLVAGMSGSTATIVAKPATGSTVLVADLSAGKFRDMVVILTETTDSIVINGGQNGGLINIQDLTDRLNTIERDLNTIKRIFNTWTPAGSVADASALKTAAAQWSSDTITETTTADIEDKKVLH